MGTEMAWLLVPVLIGLRIARAGAQTTRATHSNDTGILEAAGALTDRGIRGGGLSWDLTPVTLRGSGNVEMSMYSSPRDASGVAATVAAMRHHGIGRSFDPVGIPLNMLNSSIAAVLADANLSYVSFGAGADAQVPDGNFPRTSLTTAAVTGLRALNATQTVAVQFGEYGYFFHCLQQTTGWWHVVYPNAAEFARHQHDITPANLMGYRAMPASHAEAFAAVTAYVEKRRRDYEGWMTAYLTGHAHYSEMYAARWGANMISMEVGADVQDTQSKLAFARGSSRRFRVPFSVQVSPWYFGSCTTAGPVVKHGSTWVGSAAGHSISFVRRILLHAWFTGAALITPENSFNSFFEQMPCASDPGILSAHGEMAKGVNALIQSHDRGVPYIPVLVLIDEYAGYSTIPCNWSAAAWGIFTENAQAQETRDLNDTVTPVNILHKLFESQLFPSTGRGVTADAAEDKQLRPTPFGQLVPNLTNECLDILQSFHISTASTAMPYLRFFVCEQVDVGLSDTPQVVLAAYKTILLAGGDIDFSRYSTSEGTSNRPATLATELAAALDLNPELKLLMQPYHVTALQTQGSFARLNATGRVEVLQGSEDGVAITDDRLARLRDELLPFSVAANVSVAWQVNRLRTGSWVVELANHNGVSKAPNTTERLNASKTSDVKVTPQFPFPGGVIEWGSNESSSDQQLRGPGQTGVPVRVTLAPGSVRYIEFKL